MEPKKKCKVKSTVRDLHFCQRQDLYMVVGYGLVQIYNTNFDYPILSIRFGTSLRNAGLSSSGKFFYVVNFDYILYIYDTRTGMIIQKIVGLNNSIKDVKFSANFSRVLFGNSQLLSLWDIRGNVPLMRTQHWKNINCYDLQKDGNQFAIGTYNGRIFLMQFIEMGRCNQIEMRKHSHCVMCLCFHKEKLISYSHGGILLLATFQKSDQGRIVKYTQVNLASSPRKIESIGQNFYLFDKDGMSWFNKYNKLVGFNDKKQYYATCNEEGQIIFIKQGMGELQWWPANCFKSRQQILLDYQKQNISRNFNQQTVYVIRKNAS